jgi:hypothetical protein
MQNQAPGYFTFKLMRSLQDSNRNEKASKRHKLFASPGCVFYTENRPGKAALGVRAENSEISKRGLTSRSLRLCAGFHKTVQNRLAGGARPLSGVRGSWLGSRLLEKR